MKIMRVVVLLSVVLTHQASAIPRRISKKSKVEKRLEQQFVLSSPAFVDQGQIPVMYACDGSDISPPLRWSNPPLGTQSYALIVNDPDALGGAWTHWVVFNIPVEKNHLTQRVDVSTMGAIEGTNSWREIKYSGPCPPLKQHRYVFTLYALNVEKLHLKNDARRKDVLQAMKGHILGKAQLVGKYQRPKNK